MSSNNILASHLKKINYYASEQSVKDILIGNKKYYQEKAQSLIKELKNEEQIKIFENAYKKNQEICDKMLRDESLIKRMISDLKGNALTYLRYALVDTVVKVGFFGSIYITSSNGWATLDQVTQTANNVFDIYRQTWDFSSKERAGLKAMESKINSFYKTSDEMLKKANIITRIFIWIRSFLSINTYPSKFCWDNNTRLSDHYTKKQWFQTFGYLRFWDRPNDKDVIKVKNQPDVYYHKA